jgi:hypothetical protein
MSGVSRMSRRIKINSWLGQIIFESVLIVLSIISALAFSNWQEEQAENRLVTQSMRAFQQEIKQNRQWIESSYPYLQGINSVVTDVQAGKMPLEINNFRQMIDDIQMVVLRESTWATVVDTGVLTHMEFELVSALSLTYSLQRRLQVLYNDGQSDLIRNSYLLESNKPALMHSVQRYLNRIIEAEAELQAAYSQVYDMLNLYIALAPVQ